MKLSQRYFALVAVFIFICCGPTSATINEQSQRFILKNINIVDVEKKRIHSSMQVAITDGRITRVQETSTDVDRNSETVIDGKGGYITPGLIDMHVHMFEKGGLTLALSHGVTHVRIMNGIPAQLEWRDQVQRGELIGSSATVSSPIISAYEGTYLHHTVLTLDEAKRAVRNYHSQGYDLIKAYGNLSKEVLEGLVEESRKVGIPIAKHGPHASGDMLLSTLNELQSFEHVEDIYQGPLNYQRSAELLPPVINEIKSTGVPVTPTLNIYHQLTQLSVHKEAFLNTIEQDYTSPIIAFEAKRNQVKRWLASSDNMAKHNQDTLTFLQETTKQLHDSGVTLLVGSDSGALLSPHGLATHTEIHLMQQSGLSAFDVLAMATLNPALALGFENELGQIKPNYNADFILTRENPIENLSVLRNPDAVVKNGNWYSADELMQLRKRVFEERSLWEELTALIGAL